MRDLNVSKKARTLRPKVERFTLRQAVVNLAMLISSVMSPSRTTGAAQCFHKL